MKLKKIITPFIIIAVLILGAFYFLSIQTIPDFSMSPTFAQDAKILFLKKAYTISRGDIIFFKNSENKIMIRRVIGLPSEKVEIKAGIIFINGHKLAAEYVLPTYCSYSSETNAKSVTTLYGEPVSQDDFTSNDKITDVSVDCPNPFVLGSDEYFVLGDDVINAEDSRSFGAIKQRSILGVLLTKLPY